MMKRKKMLEIKKKMLEMEKEIQMLEPSTFNAMEENDEETKETEPENQN